MKKIILFFCSLAMVCGAQLNVPKLPVEPAYIPGTLTQGSQAFHFPTNGGPFGLIYDTFWGTLESFDPATGQFIFKNGIEGLNNSSPATLGLPVNQDATNLLARSIVAPSYNRVSAVGTVPYLGFNSWFQFSTSFTEAELFQIMSNYISTGMRDAGYNVLYADSGWAAATNIYGNGLLTNNANFPDGMAYCSSVLESNGMHLGLWICPNYFLQMGFAGGYSNNIYGLDQRLVIANAQQLVNWKIHYLKFDGGLLPTNYIPAQAFQNNFPALIQWVYQQSDFPLYMEGGFTTQFDPRATDSYSMVRGPNDATSTANFFGNIEFWATNQSAWNFTMPGLTRGVDSSLNGQSFSTRALWRTSLAYSAILPAPVVDALGTVSWSPNQISSYDLYLNPELTALIQDPEVLPGRRVAVWGEPDFNNTCEVWDRKTSRGDLLGLFNHSSGGPSNIVFDLRKASVTPGVATLRDVHGQSYIAYSSNNFINFSVPTNDCLLLEAFQGRVNPFSPGTNWLFNYGFNLSTCSNCIPLGASTANPLSWEEYRPVWNTLNPTNYANQWSMIGGIYQSNELSFNPNGGCNFWLGGCATNVGFTCAIDDLTAARGITATNLVSVYGDSVLLWSNTFSVSGSVIHPPTSITTNFSVAGVQNLSVTVLNLAGTSNIGIDSTWQDFGEFYIKAP